MFQDMLKSIYTTNCSIRYVAWFHFIFTINIYHDSNIVCYFRSCTNDDYKGLCSLPLHKPHVMNTKRHCQYKMIFTCIIILHTSDSLQRWPLHCYSEAKCKFAVATQIICKQSKETTIFGCRLHLLATSVVLQIMTTSFFSF